MRLSRLRIVGWNIRAGGGRRAAGILNQLLSWRADVVGLCEFRGTGPSQWLAQGLADAGFMHQLSSVNRRQPARNALLLASRHPLEAVTVRPAPRIRERWIHARIGCNPDFKLGLLHTPNYTRPRRKYPFLAALLRLAAATRDDAALLIGDSNCGKFELDEESPQGPRFRREHDWMVAMEARGWTDAFRHLYGECREYTWYSHRNNGFRLDHAFTSPPLTPSIASVKHAWGQDPAQPGRRDALSDHAALIVDLRPRQG